MPRLCVFCGSKVGKSPAFRNAAVHLGTLLAQRGVGLVFGGGHIGLMGVLADAVLERGGEVLGVIPQSLVDRELAHCGLTELRVTDGMHPRKAIMAELADAFAALPGGFGTADELCEMLTWAQLDLHHKPIGVLNVVNFFDPLLAWFDRMVEEGFLKPHHRQRLVVESDPAKLLEALLPIPPHRSL